MNSAATAAARTDKPFGFAVWAASLVTLALGWAGGKSVAAGEQIQGEIVDTAI